MPTRTAFRAHTVACSDALAVRNDCSSRAPESKGTEYVIKNPNSIGCKTCLSGGTTLNEWEIEDEKFYENEGKQIGARNLWTSVPNLLMGFAVWLMWSVTVAKIQAAHTINPNVYYFKDFAPEILGVSEGFRGCPGWYESACCLTWKNANETEFHAWQVSAHGARETRARPAARAPHASPRARRADHDRRADHGPRRRRRCSRSPALALRRRRRRAPARAPRQADHTPRRRRLRRLRRRRRRRRRRRHCSRSSALTLLCCRRRSLSLSRSLSSLSLSLSLGSRAADAALAAPRVRAVERQPGRDVRRRRQLHVRCAP